MPRKICMYCQQEMDEEVGEAGSHGAHPHCVKRFHPEIYERWLQLRAAE